MMRTIKQLFGYALLASLAQPSLWAAAVKQADKLSPDLRETMTLSREQRVIVTYAPGLHDSDVRALVTKSGRVAKRLAGSTAIAASLTRREIEGLERDGRILSISPDRKVVATMDVAVPTVGADRLSQYLGTGV
jgi:hypothetical protein